MITTCTKNCRAGVLKERMGMGFGDFMRAAEDRKWWKGIVEMSSVVSRQPPRLRDWDERDESQMLHAKFQGHWPLGFREGFYHIWACQPLGHKTMTISTTFHSPKAWRIHMKFGFNQPSGFGRKRGLKVWVITTTDNRAVLFYKLTL